MERLEQTTSQYPFRMRGYTHPWASNNAEQVVLPANIISFVRTDNWSRGRKRIIAFIARDNAMRELQTFRLFPFVETRRDYVSSFVISRVDAFISARIILLGALGLPEAFEPLFSRDNVAFAYLQLVDCPGFVQFIISLSLPFMIKVYNIFGLFTGV